MFIWDGGDPEPGTDVLIDFLIIIAEKISENIGVFCSIYC
jgi:hypothetical protein